MFKRTDRSRMSHVLFVSAILVYSAWYAFDAIDTVANIESAMAVVACAALVIVLGGLLLARDWLRARNLPAPTASATGAEPEAAPLASPALLSAVTILYVVLIGVIGVEISTFLCLAALARLLGVRSILANLVYSTAISALLIWMVYAFAHPPDPLIRIFGAGS